MPGGFLTLEIENNFSSIWLYSRCYSLCIPCAFFTNSAIYVNESDPRSNVHYLGSSENKARKKIQACTGFEPMTSAIPVQRSTNWANKPTGSWSWCWV